ncbi:MAG TPA: hypothetical protein VN963_10645, partial [bacterium]|nr:hypothetical protein [bacterium]
YNNAMWVIGGWNGMSFNDVWSSADGINWNEATAAAAFPVRSAHISLVFNNAMWVIAGNTTGNTNLNDVWHSP